MSFQDHIEIVRTEIGAFTTFIDVSLATLDSQINHLLETVELSDIQKIDAVHSEMRTDY